MFTVNETNYNVYFNTDKKPVNFIKNRQPATELRETTTCIMTVVKESGESIVARGSVTRSNKDPFDYKIAQEKAFTSMVKNHFYFNRHIPNANLAALKGLYGFLVYGPDFYGPNFLRAFFSSKNNVVKPKHTLESVTNLE
jgi:hypothetical protein